MPIRETEKLRYPADWKEISARIRHGRAQGWCECQGQCGLEHGIFRHCEARNGALIPGKQSKVVLTCAHLDHNPENCADENLLALCQGCHLRYDAKHHAANARQTRERKSGQLGFLFGGGR